MRFAHVFLFLATLFCFAFGQQEGFECIEKKYGRDCLHATDVHSARLSPFLLGLLGPRYNALFEYDKDENNCLTIDEWKVVPKKITTILTDELCE